MRQKQSFSTKEKANTLEIKLFKPKEEKSPPVLEAPEPRSLKIRVLKTGT